MISEKQNKQRSRYIDDSIMKLTKCNIIFYVFVSIRHIIGRKAVLVIH